MSQGGTAVYLYSGTYTWALNNTTISKSSASIISYGGQQYRRGNYVTTYKTAYYSIQAYQLCSYDPNTAPTVANRTMSGTEDTAVALTLTATDPDAGDTHSFSVVAAPSSAVGTVSISGSRATFTPAPNWNGTTTFTYQAYDSAGAASNVATVTVTIAAVNDAPSVVARTMTTNEDTAGSITLTVTDVDLNFEGDSHVWELVSVPDESEGVAVISGAKLTFTPTANWNGSTSLTYRAKDSKGVYSNTATVTITVTPVNDAPVADAKTLTTPEDTPASVTLSATDIDSPAPTVFHVVTAPNAAHGTAVISGSTLTFTPAANWNGSTSLTYQAQDSGGAWSAPVTVSITVTPVNDAPSVADRTLTTAEDTSASLTLTVTDVDLSFEGDSHVLAIVAAPPANAGQVTLVGTQLSFIPAPDWFGTTTLTYQATDSHGVKSNVGTVTITVTPVNDAPVAQAKSLALDEDTSASIQLTATDIDSPTPSVFEILTSPSSGVFTLEGGLLTYAPGLNFNGAVEFTYRAQDSSGAWSAPATVSVEVRPVNDVPDLRSSLEIRTEESAPVSVTYKVSQ
ncbi:tandem-95 repeat protein [Pseudomonas aeruginosa]